MHILLPGLQRGACVNLVSLGDIIMFAFSVLQFSNFSRFSLCFGKKLCNQRIFVNVASHSVSDSYLAGCLLSLVPLPKLDNC